MRHEASQAGVTHLRAAIPLYWGVLPAVFEYHGGGQNQTPSPKYPNESDDQTCGLYASLWPDLTPSS